MLQVETKLKIGMTIKAARHADLEGKMFLWFC
jgi:hypothetical protein